MERYKDRGWLGSEIKKGNNFSEIGREAGANRKTITYWLKKFGLYQYPKKYVKRQDIERICEICGKKKPIQEFAKWRLGKYSGYRPVCKKCQNFKFSPKTKEKIERKRASCLAYYHRNRINDERLVTILSVDDILNIRGRKECIYCGTKEGVFHIDHIIPLANGGKTELSNLILACARCNTSKNDRNWGEWFREQIFYSREKEDFIWNYLNQK